MGLVGTWPPRHNNWGCYSNISNGLHTCPRLNPSASPGVSYWVMCVSSGLSSKSTPPLQPPLLSCLGTQFSSCPINLPLFLATGFRPWHVFHSVSIPPLITSHTSGFFMRGSSFKTISNQVRESLHRIYYSIYVIHEHHPGEDICASTRLLAPYMFYEYLLFNTYCNDIEAQIFSVRLVDTWPLFS